MRLSEIFDWIGLTKSVPVISCMEWWGIGFEVTMCRQHAELISFKLTSLTHNAFQLAKRKFDLNDNKVGIFFEISDL